ncbi:MAG TPA: RICIN domain-containing protein [Actinoplanes sp.]|nr:RICIN domain-containing protein [Actinoplanes sp.]
MAAVCAVVAGVAVVPSPASAAEGAAVLSLRNRATWKCLDSRLETVYAKTCTFNLNQSWLVVMLSDGHYIFQNLATAKCLDSNAAGAAYTRKCDTKNHYQQWRSSGPLNYLNRATGRALDSNARVVGSADPDLGSVYTRPLNDGEYQKWNVLKKP